MFTIHINQTSRLVVKPSTPSQHGENASTGEMVKILEKGSTIMLEPVERNSEKWFGANCYHNGMEFPVTKKPLFGPLNEISFDLFNYSFLNSFGDHNIGVKCYEKDSKSLFEWKQQSSTKDADESDLSLGSDGGTCDVSEFTSDEETVGKKRSVSVQEDERPKKKKLKYVDPRQSVISEDEPRLILDIDSKSKEILVEVNNRLVKELKPHQLEGIKFMYNSTIGSVSELTKSGSGCILAHCIGSGKTLQVLILVQTLLSNFHTKDQIKTILIAVPVYKQRIWIEMFDKWITNNGLKTFEINELVSEIEVAQQLKCLNLWKSKGGVLIVSHRLISDLLNSRFRTKMQISSSEVALLDEYLVKPGPDMFIIDEGHLIRTTQSCLSQAADKIQTKRKILTSGSSLRQNLVEYHAMVGIIKPDLLGSRSEFLKRFGNPIEGWKSKSEEKNVKLRAQRLAVLHQLLSNRINIQRFGFDTLRPYLQPKYEYALFIRPTKLSAQMYNFYLEHATNNLSLDRDNLNFCVNHPALQYIQKERIEANMKSSLKHKKVNACSVNDKAKIPGSENDFLPKNWYEAFVNYDDLENIDLSCKFILLFKILRACISVGDKLVVVVQFLETLDLIERYLKSVEKIQTGDNGEIIKWNRDKNYFRIDDSTTEQERHGQLIHFNDSHKKHARLLLLPAKFGNIDLTGANRIILFDVSWDINYDIEAISSVYRLGQTKEVYVYRFVAKDSMEELSYRRQIKHVSVTGKLELYAIRPKESYHYFDRPLTLKDSLLSNILLDDNEEVLQITEAEILLENKPEEELTEEELREAWDKYKKECEEDNQRPKREKKHEKLCDTLREEKMKNLPFNEQFENTNGPSEIGQIDEEIDVKPSASFLLNALATSSPISSGPTPNIVKQEPKGPKKNEISLRSITSSQTQEINSRKSTSEDKNSSNWLDISHVPIDSVLLVKTIRRKIYQDGNATAMTFRANYKRYGKYKNEIIYIHREEDCIRIYVNRPFRAKVKQELIKFNNCFRLPHKFEIDKRLPMIKFEWDQEIDHQNQFEMITRIKSWNRWNQQVTWVMSEWSSHLNKFSISLAVSTAIRKDIEKENGTISLGRHRVSVIDDFGIIQCFRCSEYGHTASNCKNPRRCGFCGGDHGSDCKVKEPSKWRCCLCRVQGHSAFSKHCPTLIDYLRPKLEEIDHNYKYIFLDNDREC